MVSGFDSTEVPTKEDLKNFLFGRVRGGRNPLKTVRNREIDHCGIKVETDVEVYRKRRHKDTQKKKQWIFL